MNEINTVLSNAIDIADDKARYDETVKNLLANKEILAQILKYTVNELSDYSVDNIQNYIEGEPQISRIMVEPGMTNHPKIIGMMDEDGVPNEGYIRYDIIFRVSVPDIRYLSIIVNVEAQKEFYPGYELIPRGIFYCSRMLSAQLNREFKANDYDKLKKVYSIWICMEVPRYAINTITRYHMTESSVYGNYRSSQRYDLLEVVMIYLGEAKDTTESNLIRLLNVLLSEKISPQDKKILLQEEFGIQPTVKMEGGLRQMCNLSDLVEKRGMERGMKRGIQQGIGATIRVCRKYGSANEEIINTLMEEYSISEEEARAFVIAQA